MKQFLKHVTLLVDDYGLAIQFYCEVLGFDLIEDTRINDDKRWILVRPKGASECSILLSKASNFSQRNTIGNQAGGRVFLFLSTDDFDRDYRSLQVNNVTIVRKPRTESYGNVAVFQDPFGNLWDLIGPAIALTTKLQLI